LEKSTSGDEEQPVVDKTEILERAQSEYEAVVAIAKEARRLNAAPGVYLEDGEKAIPKAVKNFVDGKVDYEIEDDHAGGRKTRKRRRKSK
jgi:DNA-directed RNA polymerase subunit K/omega